MGLILGFLNADLNLINIIMVSFPPF